MAAPQVAGVIGLLWSKHPSLTYEQVRDWVLGRTRPVSALQEKTVTGGVVNAYRAISYDCNANGYDDYCDINCLAFNVSSNVFSHPCDVGLACRTSPDCAGYESNCCAAHAGMGCDDPGIEDCVCTDGGIGDCCSVQWTKECAEHARNDCEPSVCYKQGDGIPDECQPSQDRDGNNVIDPCDLVCGTSQGDPCNVPGCGGGTDCNANCIPDAYEIQSDPPVSLDCNGNQIPDECDIANGTSCDADLDAVPDACAACCMPSGDCQNVLPTRCSQEGGVPYPGLTCGDPNLGYSKGECTCFDVACCGAASLCQVGTGPSCCAVVPGCECVDAGAIRTNSRDNRETRSVPTAVRATGSCCDGKGGCRDRNTNVGTLIVPNDCRTTEEYIGGVRCKGGECRGDPSFS